ncbi:MAG: hypothetical protein RID91_10450 [Azospirillaceae bacterium]
MSERITDALARFRDDFNANDRVKSLVRNWNRVIRFEADGVDAVWYMAVTDGEMRLLDGPPADGGDPVIEVATHDPEILATSFDGTGSPARAHMDGDLELYCAETDRVKLDAISLVLWGA